MSIMKPVTITLTGEQVEALGYALDLAFDDQTSYLKWNNPNDDYGAEWPEAAQQKAATFRLIGEVGEAIGFHGEASRWGDLADEVLETLETEAT